MNKIASFTLFVLLSTSAIADDEDDLYTIYSAPLDGSIGKSPPRTTGTSPIREAVRAPAEFPDFDKKSSEKPLTDSSEEEEEFAEEDFEEEENPYKELSEEEKKALESKNFEYYTRRKHVGPELSREATSAGATSSSSLSTIGSSKDKTEEPINIDEFFKMQVREDQTEEEKEEEKGK